MVKGSMKWKTEMMVHKSGRKINKKLFYRSASGVLNTVCVMMVCICIGSFPLLVQAAPATLTSPDATVYEQADEGSSPVGNLVEGSTFEYIGDVTAADGSLWHQITTAGGVNGYIRGDREIEAGTKEPAAEEQGEPEAAPENTGSNPDGSDTDENNLDGSNLDGNVPADAGEGNIEGAPDEGTGIFTGENAGELPEENNPIPAADMQNNQQKKYVLDPSGKIKERESFAALNADVPNVKSMRAGIDKTLYISIAVVLFCFVTVHICLKRIRMLKYKTNGGEILDTGRSKAHKKQKRKNTALKGKKGAKRS